MNPSTPEARAAEARTLAEALAEIRERIRYHEMWAGLESEPTIVQEHKNDASLLRNCLEALATAPAQPEPPPRGVFDPADNRPGARAERELLAEAQPPRDGLDAPPNGFERRVLRRVLGAREGEALVDAAHRVAARAGAAGDWSQPKAPEPRKEQP